MGLFVEILDKYIISGITGNTAHDLIKKAWAKANAKSWEDLYFDAFQAAVDDMRRDLKSHPGVDEVAIDRSTLSSVLHHDLGAAVDTWPLSKLRSENFLAELAKAMEASQVLVIGGHNLTRDDYAQLVRNLVMRAKANFYEAILQDEQGFNRALLSEGLATQALAEQILSTIRRLMEEIQAGKPQPVAPLIPRLRPPVADFVGREPKIEQFVKRLMPAIIRGTTAVTGCVCGMGGMGKTELAHAIAQHLIPYFPDGQVLVELRGTRSNPLTPDDALQTVIVDMGQKVESPVNLDRLQAQYRSYLTGKRVLVLADDAKDAPQVAPLILPPKCLLLITTRLRFRLPGMEVVDLNRLPPRESEALLHTICPRIGKAASHLAELCDYLPLALRVSASVLANDETLPVERYIEKLEDTHNRLKHLIDPEDPNLNVEACLQLSYKMIDRIAQRVLCQLSVFHDSFDLKLAQEVVEVPKGHDVEVTLGLLYRRSLLEWDERVQQYALHDLVRDFAAARLPRTATAATARRIDVRTVTSLRIVVRSMLEMFDKHIMALRDALLEADVNRQLLDLLTDYLGTQRKLCTEYMLRDYRDFLSKRRDLLSTWRELINRLEKSAVLINTASYIYRSHIEDRKRFYEDFFSTLHRTRYEFEEVIESLKYIDDMLQLS